MADREATAAEFEAMGDKKLTGGWSSFFSGGLKYEDAAENYHKAAIQYKLAENWKKAGSLYVKIADCHLKGNSKYEAASAYVDAANCFKKVSAADAARALDQAVNIFLETSRLNMAARHCKDAGEIYDQEQDLEKALDYFDRAANLFSRGEQSSQANTCRQKVAQIAAQLEQQVI